MSDSYTTVSTQSWGSRLGNSIKSVLVGLVLFVVAFPVLFFNEGCSVRRSGSLGEFFRDAVTIDPAKVDAANDKKPVFLSDKADTKDTVKDDTFGVKATAIRLDRSVQMYQWIEKKTEKKEKQVGGSEKTVTNYTYDLGWSDKWQDSSKFGIPEARIKNHNPGMAYESSAWTADKVTIGAFTIPAKLVESIKVSTPLPAAADTVAGLSADLKNKIALKADGSLYYSSGAPTTQPEGTPPTADKAALGDLKIRFSVVMPQDVAIGGQQVGAGFQPYTTSVAKADPIFELRVGKMTKEQLHEKLASENTMRTWLVRLGGFAMMFIGLMMIASPIAVFGDVVPLIGGFLRAGAGLFAFVIAAALSFITIALAWVVYRPVVGILLLVVGVGAIVLLKLKAKSSKPAAPAPAPPGVAR